MGHKKPLKSNNVVLNSKTEEVLLKNVDLDNLSTCVIYHFLLEVTVFSYDQPSSRIA